MNDYMVWTNMSIISFLIAIKNELFVKTDIGHATKLNETTFGQPKLDIQMFTLSNLMDKCFQQCCFPFIIKMISD